MRMIGLSGRLSVLARERDLVLMLTLEVPLKLSLFGEDGVSDSEEVSDTAECLFFPSLGESLEKLLAIIGWKKSQ